MVKVSKVSKNEIKRLVEIAFNGDSDLVEKYHIINKGFSEAVDSTVGRIIDTSRIYDYKFFKVLHEKKPVGFFVVGNQVLYSFGINIKYRTKNILANWWELVKKELGSQFMSMLYSKNERAVNYLKNRGMVVSDDDGIITTLVNKI